MQPLVLAAEPGELLVAGRTVAGEGAVAVVAELALPAVEVRSGSTTILLMPRTRAVRATLPERSAARTASSLYSGEKERRVVMSGVSLG